MLWEKEKVGQVKDQVLGYFVSAPLGVWGWWLLQQPVWSF